MISNLEQVREDGKVFNENITLDKAIAQGWLPSRVIEVRWEWEGRRLRLVHALGLLVTVVPGNHYLAALFSHDESGVDATLHVLDGTGESRFKMADALLIGGRRETGTYSWFESGEGSRLGVFRAAFRCKRNEAFYLVDINAETGMIMAIGATR